MVAERPVAERPVAERLVAERPGILFNLLFQILFTIEHPLFPASQLTILPLYCRHNKRKLHYILCTQCGPYCLTWINIVAVLKIETDDLKLQTVYK